MLRLVSLTLVAMLASGLTAAYAQEPPVQLPVSAVTGYPVGVAGSYVTALALGPEGSMWFGETSPGRIVRISPTGVITGEYDTPTGESIPSYEARSEPSGLALGADGKMWFTDTGDNQEGEDFVGSVNPSGVMMKVQLPAYSYPLGIALGADENMWFANTSGKIGRITSAGVLTEFAVPGSSQIEFGTPLAMARGVDGNIWFTDGTVRENGQYSIGRITPAGGIEEFPIPLPYERPTAIVLGADGDMWFTEGVNAIGRITPAGAITEFPIRGLEGAYDSMALGPDGNIWFTQVPNALGRITPAGAVQSFKLPASAPGAPSALARGPEGELWFAAEGAAGEGPRLPYVGRFTVPFAPAAQAPPTISGQTLQGQTLMASEGSWSHAPGAFAYQWQVCDELGSNCTNIAGQTEASHLLAASEVGHTLRVVVDASNIGGAVSATSAATAVITALPQPPGPPPPLAPLPVVPLPVVGSAMTWNFAWSRTYTLIDSLLVRSVPAGALVSVTCHGRGCAFASWRSDAPVRHHACRGACKTKTPKLQHGAISLASLFEKRHLGVGAKIVVDITKAGSIGKSFVFTVRANRSPRVQIACLGAQSAAAAGKC